MEQKIVYLVEGFDGDPEVYSTYEKARAEFDRRLEYCRTDNCYHEISFIEDEEDNYPFVSVRAEWTNTPGVQYDLDLIAVPFD